MAGRSNIMTPIKSGVQPMPSFMKPAVEPPVGGMAPLQSGTTVRQGLAGRQFAGMLDARLKQAVEPPVVGAGNPHMERWPSPPPPRIGSFRR